MATYITNTLYFAFYLNLSSPDNGFAHNSAISEVKNIDEIMLLSSFFPVQHGVYIWNLLHSVTQSATVISQRVLLLFSAGTWPPFSSCDWDTVPQAEKTKSTEEDHQRYQNRNRIETYVINQLGHSPLKELLLIERVSGRQTGSLGSYWLHNCGPVPIFTAIRCWGGNCTSSGSPDAQ